MFESEDIASNVISAGDVTSGEVVSRIVTSCCPLAVFAASSATNQVTVVLPNPKN